MQHDRGSFLRLAELATLRPMRSEERANEAGKVRHGRALRWSRYPDAVQAPEASLT